MKFKKKKDKNANSIINYAYDGKNYKMDIDEMSDAGKIAIARISEIRSERMKTQIHLEETNLLESHWVRIANKEFNVDEDSTIRK